MNPLAACQIHRTAPGAVVAGYVVLVDRSTSRKAWSSVHRALRVQRRRTDAAFAELITYGQCERLVNPPLIEVTA